MSALGNGLHDAGHYEDALRVQEARLSMLRRLGYPEESILAVQNNLACTYQRFGRFEEALRMWRDVYSAHLEHNGEEHEKTLLAANNYATSLHKAERFEEVKSLLRKTVPVARRVLGDCHDLTLGMRCVHAVALFQDDNATLDDLREAATTLEDAGRIARRVFGGAHPLAAGIESALRESRAILAACETP